MRDVHEIFISFGMWMSAVCRRNFPQAPNSLINQSKRNEKKRWHFLEQTRKCVGLFSLQHLESIEWQVEVGKPEIRAPINSICVD